MAKRKKRKGRFRLDLMMILSIFILIISFFAYMSNTTLEDVLKTKYPDGVVIHQEDYGSKNSSSSAEN